MSIACIANISGSSFLSSAERAEVIFSVMKYARPLQPPSLQAMSVGLGTELHRETDTSQVEGTRGC
jgi:hypothetical protein